MRKVSISLFSLLLCTLCLTSFGQSQLPKEWMGQWRGTLEIFNAQGRQQTVAMGLNIFAKSDTSWAWQIEYGEGETAQLRDYELISNGDSNHFKLDEKNSIVLYLSLINGGLYSAFEVQTNQLLISYELKDEALIFRTYSFPASEELVTGKGEGIPEVKARRTTTVQIARLTKQ